ncbi:40S ribosomal protein S15 [Fusarium oxysporum f. sp. conglutinans race 2 54008]|nr:40S ribosomal protein S15 [Fusarium oxysporum f. sp. conglutinans race 2 54008]EXM27805.1 40S ribosomal protein S15 [Fusarium oxysporum f. sp. vasinfectum 25433]
MRGRRARTLHRSFPVRLSDCCNNRLQIDPSQAIRFPLSEFNNTTPRSWLTNTTPSRLPSSRERERSESSPTEESTLISMLPLHDFCASMLEDEELRGRTPERTDSMLMFDFSPLHRLLDLSSDQLRDVVHARARRRINRGLKRRPMGLIKKLRKAKQEAQPNEKPDLVKTHLRDMIVVPEMIGSVIGIYSGKEFNQVEIKPEMVGHYLAEFSISYKPVKHGRPGIGATHSSRFIPLK